MITRRDISSFGVVDAFKLRYRYHQLERKYPDCASGEGCTKPDKYLMDEAAIWDDINPALAAIFRNAARHVR